MTLREQQSLHVQLTAKLIAWIYAAGYELTWGQTTRTQAQADANAADGAGIKNSLHLIGLAVDLNLFKDGVYLSSVNDYAPFGTYWKSLSTLARWGGDFHSPDADHFSLTWAGIQ